jgi:hypothetical protein
MTAGSGRLPEQRDQAEKSSQVGLLTPKNQGKTVGLLVNR